ncbi:phosphoethanolamine transferase [Psychrobacter pygoscelis]|uniref:phosphoethanolamine transferase n=1 Tax=Psychrobacter pygoscelis TaxID=2488563 RepID=UPI00103ED7B1|nr:phosphoethanolamine--lipid A transferase [Psychrobacter pygoscelis]
MSQTKPLSKHTKYGVLPKDINHNLLVGITALYLVATANLGFFAQVLAVYPFATNFGFIISMIGLLFGLFWLLLQLLCYRLTTKAVLIAMVMIAAICGYFTDSYGTIFDSNMLINGLQTDQAEAMDLIAPSFIVRVLLVGVVPAIIIAKLRLKRVPVKRATLQKIITLLAAIALAAVCILPFGDQYASFFRQHKQVRYYTNPVTPIYSVIKLAKDSFDDWRRPDTMTPRATDAKRTVSSLAKPKLMVFVVGETVRADHVGLNGYSRNTTPLLSKQQDVYSYKEATSCGTSTAYSVPCMFSYMDRNNYNMDEANYQENVLDTLSQQGIHVIWRDNNSSSKGVADRVVYQEFKSPDTNPDCDEECRDMGMLAGFDKLIADPPKPASTVSDNSVDSVNKDMLIILHQMGNHGPAYYKRYPKAFELYTPVCMSNELSKCDTQSVINAYDNAVVYTDYFLNSVIEALKKYQDSYDVVMVYMSDHGESLGENNIYLHGLPYKVAPESQKHVPLIIWSPANGPIDAGSIEAQLNQPVSHDGITPTLLSFFGITTEETVDKPAFFKLRS